MKKSFLITIGCVLLLIFVLVSIIYQIQNNISPDNKLSNKNTPISDNSNTNNSSLDNLDNQEYNLDSSPDTSLATNTPNNTNDILISSPEVDYIVSINENSNDFEINTSSNENLDDFNTYASIDEQYYNYLLENKDILIEEFMSSNVFEKYNMINEILDNIDTNIDTSQLINLALGLM